MTKVNGKYGNNLANINEDGCISDNSNNNINKNVNSYNYSSSRKNTNTNNNNSNSNNWTSENPRKDA